MAIRASALYIAIGQIALAMGAIGQGHGSLVDIAFLRKGKKKVVNDTSMIGGSSSSKQIKADAQPFPRAEKLLMVSAGYLLRLFALLLSTKGYRGAVLVAAGDHQHLIALGTVVSGEDIRWKVCPSNMPQVQGAISIRPGYPNKDPFTQISTPRINSIINLLFTSLNYQSEFSPGLNEMPYCLAHSATEDLFMNLG
jgi:hypothetical protein